MCFFSNEKCISEERFVTYECKDLPIKPNSSGTWDTVETTSATCTRKENLCKAGPFNLADNEHLEWDNLDCQEAR